jgi:DNA-binding MarR family transcriptional regulator
MPQPKDGATDFGVLPETVGYWLRSAQAAAAQSFVRGQTASALTPGQFAALVLIDRNSGLTQQRLSRALGIDKSTLVATLHRLSARALVRRMRSGADRRENELSLTAKGRTALARLTRHVRAQERRLTARLSARERATLLELLARIAETPGL